MGTLYIDTGGAATNSGSSDNNAADLSGTGDAVVTGSVVQLTIGTNLSGVNTSGANQSAIYINDATNANRKIFWITAKDDALDQVTVDVAPTGVTASNWAIGGRYAAPAGNGLNLIDGALRAGDVVTVNNSPAAASVDWITGRAAGTSAAGNISLKGKSGSRPVINVTNTTQCIEQGGQVLWWYENLELDQDGASGNVINNASSVTVYNIKVSDGGGDALQGLGTLRVLASEFSGVGGDGIDQSSSTYALGNYIHDVTGNGINFTGGNNGHVAAIKNIIDTCGGRGILVAGSVTTTGNMVLIDGQTIYGCGDTGIEITDIDQLTILTNNITSENGNAAGEFNVEYVAGAAELIGFHGWNVFFHSGGGGGANLSNLTVNAQVAASEFTTDPAFTNAASGDFSIGSTSPAKATGYPGQFLGGSLGYLDIGAVQRQESGAGGLLTHPGMAGGMRG